MSESETTKLLITVKLITGEEMVHQYDVPNGLKEAKEFVGSLADLTASALMRGQKQFLPLQNPSIGYNPDNIIFVKVDFLGSEELNEAFRKAQKKALGFKAD